MKRKLLLVLALIALAMSFVLPVAGGWGEWPCELRLVAGPTGLDLDCVGNSGNCLCLIFTY